MQAGQSRHSSGPLSRLQAPRHRGSKRNISLVRCTRAGYYGRHTHMVAAGGNRTLYRVDAVSGGYLTVRVNPGYVSIAQGKEMIAWRLVVQIELEGQRLKTPLKSGSA